MIKNSLLYSSRNEPRKVIFGLISGENYTLEANFEITIYEHEEKEENA